MEKEEKEILIENYLKNPDIFNYIVNELDKEIVGEKETIKVILLCSMGRLVINCITASYNLLVNSTAGSGKDYVTTKTLSIFPKDIAIKRTRISPAVLNYWHNSKAEPDWTWDGKILYLEDISENVLNSDTFKVMTSSGSHTTILKDQKVIDMEVKGKPICIVTTANSIPSPELTRRFEFCNLDESEEQTKEIMKRHSFYAIDGEIPQIDTNLIKIHPLLKRYKVSIPFSPKLDKYFPFSNIMLRTKYPRFLDFIRASCCLHQYQRKINENGKLIAQEQDYEIARTIMQRLSKNKMLVPLTIKQQKIMKWFEENPDKKINAVDLSNELHNFVTLKYIVSNLNILVQYQLIEKTIGENPFGKDIDIYQLSDTLETIQKLDLPHFKDL